MRLAAAGSTTRGFLVCYWTLDAGQATKSAQGLVSIASPHFRVRRIYIDSDRAMEQVPDDLWRIVFAFAGPTPGARQAAARARTLVEFVEYRLAGAGEFGDWNENTIIKRGVVHTRAHY